MRSDLVKKYNIPVPRYTSFPPVPFWNGAPHRDLWFDHLRQQSDGSYELYIHIPYCDKICFYCGCNRVLGTKSSQGDQYVDYLLKEWKHYTCALPELKISSLHLGGGTPNFLSEAALDKLLGTLLMGQSNFTGSVEVDPRTCRHSQIDMFAKYGFKRLSLGIQDFDPKVQGAIGRVQSFEKVSALVEHARSLGFNELNLDLIYGLPHQDESSIHSTIKKVIQLNPSQVSFYSYAHLPDKIPNQKLIPQQHLPQGAQKRKLYELGKELLTSAGHEEIGLDHFAREKTELLRAKREGKLRRNFMGHTLKVSSHIIGLGVSAISSSSVSFSQNCKKIKDYYQALDQGQLPVATGHVHDWADIQVEKIMQQLFATDSVPAYMWQELPQLEQLGDKLQSLEADGLIILDEQGLKVPSTGRPFIRNIASAFDHHLRDHQFGMAL